MPTLPTNIQVTAKQDGAAPNYMFPLVLVTSLFFMWGFAYGLLDSLNKHFQDLFGISKAASGLLQAAYFGGYFLMALPAGLIMKKYGYKRGILLGLSLYSLGALLGAFFLFLTAGSKAGYYLFLVALFVLACGLCCLETASNPYVTVLGKPESSEFRLNLSQCFNGVGSFFAPFLAAYVFFGGNQVAVITGQGHVNLSSVQYTYLVIGIVIFGLFLIFRKVHLPEINEEKQLESTVHHHSTPLFHNRHFVWGVIAQFFYVAAQVGVAAYFINYTTENWHGVSAENAAKLLGVSLILFTAGRFAGTALMRVIRPSKLLAVYALVNILLCAYVIYGTGAFSVYALMAIFFFESIMFPTIFALGIKDLGEHTKRGGSFIIMSIVGGALCPFIMGWIADRTSTPAAYWIPLVCFVFVLYYGIGGHRVRR